MVNVNCYVPGCVSNNRSYQYLKFYKLPKDGARRRRWKKLTRNTRERDSQWTCLCRLHFEDGSKKGFYSDPTIFPWSPEWPDVVASYNNYVTERFSLSQGTDHGYAKAPKLMQVPAISKKFVRHSNTSKRALKSLEESEGTCALPNTGQESDQTHCLNLEEPPIALSNNGEVGSRDVTFKDTSTTMKVAYYPETYLLTRNELQSLLSCIEEQLEKGSPDVSQLLALLKVVIKLLRNVQEQLDTVMELREWDKFLLRRFEGSDEDIKFWTGFPSYASLIYFFNGFILPNEPHMKYWGANNTDKKREFKAGTVRQLSILDELFLTLIKLKRASANEDLAERFNMSSRHVSSIVITWVNLMAAAFRKTDTWLSRKKVRKLMPSCFKPLYSDVIIIVDCTEMEIERPSDLEIQCATYSTYKSRNTVKGLVGLSPTGVTTFISHLMEGSVSDNDITVQSGLLAKLQKGDAIIWQTGAGQTSQHFSSMEFD